VKLRSTSELSGTACFRSGSGQGQYDAQAPVAIWFIGVPVRMPSIQRACRTQSICEKPGDGAAGLCRNSGKAVAALSNKQRSFRAKLASCSIQLRGRRRLRERAHHLVKANGENMSWHAPKFIEVSCAMEITRYAPADGDEPILF
jgi:coenzyme PQQ precursor peptide PqqA